MSPIGFDFDLNVPARQRGRSELSYDRNKTVMKR